MSIRRVPVVLLTALVLAAHAAASSAASAYPAKPLRFVIPFPAGGFSDILGRLIAQKLSDRIGQPVVCDNRPGASGNIGAEIAEKATPDGYTLLINSFNYVINPSVMSLHFDPIKDFDPVSQIAEGPPQVMTVAPGSPYRTVQDVIADAKAHPGKLNFATAGNGTSPHLAVELLKSTAGINVVMVPFKGSILAVTSVMSGEIAVMFPNLPVVLPLLKSGKLRGLAVTSAQRSPALPDLPTMAESGYPAFEQSGFVGLLAPRHTPKAIIEQLYREMAAIAKEPDFGERLAIYGMRPVGSTPEAFKRFMQNQIVKWRGVFEQAKRAR